MKLEINVTKTKLFVIVLSLFVIFGLFFVFAYSVSLGSVPNPGHSILDVQGYFSGDANLNQTLGKFCQSDGTNCLASGGVVSGGLYGYCIQAVTGGDCSTDEKCGLDIPGPAPISPSSCSISTHGKLCSCSAGYTPKTLSNFYVQTSYDGNGCGITTSVVSCLKN